MNASRSHFATGNLTKLLALPMYVLGWLLAWFVPRAANSWVFGSGIGLGEGALEVAHALHRQDPDARIFWMIGRGPTFDEDAARVVTEGWTPVTKASWRGFWVTLRSRTLVVTHGLGDVNRFAPFRATIVQLWHGVPLKRIHLDSPVTTRVSGPAPLRSILRRMYLRGARQVTLYVAGSQLAAERLRSAFRVAPGAVQVLGDPRDDVLARQAADLTLQQAARTTLTEALGLVGVRAATWILYAPTWRDGAPDPAVPTPEEASRISAALADLDAHLVIRPHPLGAGAYDDVLGDRIHLLGSGRARDLTPLLGAFDALITDFSSVAVDMSLLQRPIVWFAPDLAEYTASRGLYEPLEVTSGQRVDRTWEAVITRLIGVLTPGSAEERAALRVTAELRQRFIEYPEGGAAERVVAAVRRVQLSDADLIPGPAIFFESFYGRQVSCNPLALDREIAGRFPHVTRYWSVIREDQEVPSGAIPVLEGGREWHAVRRRANLLIVNDWLRRGFTRRSGQTVLQTWHGTMLKHLALGRPRVRLRQRIAILRERRRWTLLLSQNPHSTEQFRTSYAYRGEVLEVGYPRDDRLAQAMVSDRHGGREVNPVVRQTARARLGIPADASVLVYAPTWRERQVTVTNDLDVHSLARALGDPWVVVARGHTRTHGLTGYGQRSGTGGTVIDASQHPDVNDVLLAADLVVTDYSSIMFDAAVAQLPQLFFVPDLAAYRDRERGFTFDFERTAPGPLLTSRDEVLEHARAFQEAGNGAAWIEAYAPAASVWRNTYAPHDDGRAAARVVDALASRGDLPA